jgi:putative transposase
VTPPNGDYFYTTTFTMPSNLNVTSEVGTLTVLADDTVAVYLNGVRILDAPGGIGPGNGYYHCSDLAPNCVTPFTFSFTGITSGQNALTFDVKQVNGASEGLDYVGSIHLNSIPVTLSPGYVRLYANQTQQFQANVGVDLLPCIRTSASMISDSGEDDMSKSKHSEAQMITALKQVEAGRTAEDVAREYGVSKHTIYAWKAKFGGMDASEAQKLRALEDENSRLKRLVADLSLDREMLKAVIAKNGLSS